MSVNDAIALRQQEPLPRFQPYTEITQKQMLNLVKEGHIYEEKFNALGVPFDYAEVKPLPFVEKFFKYRRWMEIKSKKGY